MVGCTSCAVKQAFAAHKYVKSHHWCFEAYMPHWMMMNAPLVVIERGRLKTKLISRTETLEITAGSRATNNTPPQLLANIDLAAAKCFCIRPKLLFSQAL